MKLKHLAVAAAAISLAGCVNGSLQLPTLPTPPAAAPQQLNLASNGGQTHTVAVTIPPRTCNATTYLSGFKTGYITSWNQQLSDLAMTATTKDRRTQLASNRLQPAPAEALPLPSSQTLDQGACDSNSRTVGIGDGGTQAHNDFIAFSQSH